MLFFCTFAVAMRKKLYLYTLYSLFLLASCADKKPQQELTPWGTPVGEVESMDGSDEEESDEKRSRWRCWCSGSATGFVAVGYPGQWRADHAYSEWSYHLL